MNEERLVGTGASQLVQLIQKFGYNKDVDVELATVTAPPPNLKIKIDNMNVELEKDDLVVAQHLTKHKRRLTIKGTNSNLVSSSVIDSMTQNGSGPHTHDITSLTIQGNLTVTDAEIEFLDELKAGERVIVASVDNGQLYIVLDRAVMY
ncbi:DUF2577 domain-containing protein [Fredinandcohnia humi]